MLKDFIIACIVSQLLGGLLGWQVATDNLLGNFIVFFGWSAPFFYLALRTYRKVSEPDYGTDNDPKGILVERAAESKGVLELLADCMEKGIYDDNLIDALYSLMILTGEETCGLADLEPLAEALFPLVEQKNFAKMTFKERIEVACFLRGYQNEEQTPPQKMNDMIGEISTIVSR